MATSKRDQLIDTAMKLFYENGFHATGIDKVLAESGCAKMTLYKHFKSKDELILATIRRRDELLRNEFMREVERRAKTPRERLIAFYDVLEDWFKGGDFRGCLFMHASSEYTDTEDPILGACAEHQRLMRKYVRDLCVEAGAKDVDELADELMLLGEGAIITAHMMSKPGVAQNAKRAAVKLIDLALA